MAQMAAPPVDEAARTAPAKVITTKQLRAVRLLLQKRRESVSIPIGSGSILEYVMQAMPELDRAKVVAAAFGGKAPCKVYRWTELDLAVIIFEGIHAPRSHSRLARVLVRGPPPSAHPINYRRL